MDGLSEIGDSKNFENREVNNESGRLSTSTPGADAHSSHPPTQG